MGNEQYSCAYMNIYENTHLYKIVTHLMYTFIVTQKSLIIHSDISFYILTYITLSSLFNTNIIYNILRVMITVLNIYILH